MTIANDEAVNDGLAKIKEVYDDGFLTVNGRDYKFTKATHKKRLKIFSYLTGVQKRLENNDMSFMGEEGYEAIENLIGELVTFEGSLLCKIPNHWNEYPQDYMLFSITAMQVISYPFLQGAS